MPDVVYEVAGHVATITLNRPERRNALTLPMLDDLAEVMRGADADPEVRAIVLTGAGEGFCAGLDLVEAAAQGPGAVDDIATSYRPERIPVLAMHQADTPIVAAVNGAAAGYGVGLALNADLRVMARGARFVPPTRRALVPESGDTYLLPRLAGWERAARFYFLGEDLAAEAALAAGVVSEVAEDADACRARAAELAAADRRPAPAGGAGGEANDAGRPHRRLRGPRVAGAPAVAAPVPHRRLRRGHGGLPAEAAGHLHRPVRPLSLATARRMALAAQGLAAPRPAGRVDLRHLRRVFARVGAVQIDPINVVERAPHLTLFARLGPHDRELLWRAYNERHELMEYWAHAACFLPVDAYPLFRHRMEAERPWADGAPPGGEAPRLRGGGARGGPPSRPAGRHRTGGPRGAGDPLLGDGVDGGQAGPGVAVRHRAPGGGGAARPGAPLRPARAGHPAASTWRPRPRPGPRRSAPCCCGRRGRWGWAPPPTWRRTT